MESQEKPRRKRWIIPAAVVVAAGAAFAAVQVCEAPLAEIRSGKRSISDIVATVKKGEQVDVVEKDARGWLKVKVNGKEGYVYESALKSADKRGLFASSDPRASATELAAAGKGLNDTAIQYASSKNLSTAGVEKMLEARRRITEKDFEAFVAEGNLKPMAGATPAPKSDTVAVADVQPTQAK